MITPRKNFNHGLYIFCLFLFIFFLSLHRCAYATFSVTVQPHEGSQELDFGPANTSISEINREVDVNINTDIAAQYEFRQEPLSPLRNGKGEEIPWNNLSVRGLIATNKFGNLKIQPEPVLNSVIYTSSSSGASDSFTLVYALRLPPQATPDFYRGQVRFTIVPINSSQSSISAFLNFVVQVQEEPGKQVKASFELTTVRGSKTITLNPKKDETKSVDVSVKVNGKFKKTVMLKQYIPQDIESSEGARLDYEVINVATKDTAKGTGISKTPLSAIPVVIYTSKPTGEIDDSFTITYSLGDFLNQRAGRYVSRIQYVLDEAGFETRLDTLGLEIESEPIFDLAIKAEDDREIIEFRDLKPEGLAQSKKVTIEVKTNTGKRYQVSQNVFSDLSNADGVKLSNEYFTMRTQDLDTKGNLKFPDKTQVSIGEAVLFVSDSKGSSDKFEVIYDLSCPKNLKAGSYSTRVTYSLSEL